MKKLFLIAITICMILCTVACSSEETVNTDSNMTVSNTTEDTTVQMENIQEDTEVNEEPTCILFNEEEKTVAEPQTAYLKAPEFDINTVAQVYAKSEIVDGTEEHHNLINQLENNTSGLARPRAFYEGETPVIVWLNVNDGYLYKNYTKLNVRAEDCILLENIPELPETKEEIIAAYNEGLGVLGLGFAEQALLTKLSKEIDEPYLEKPRLFRRGNEVFVIFNCEEAIYCNESKLS